MKIIQRIKQIFCADDMKERFQHEMAAETPWSYSDIKNLVTTDLYIERLAMRGDRETFKEILRACHKAGISLNRYLEVYDRRKA